MDKKPTISRISIHKELTNYEASKCDHVRTQKQAELPRLIQSEHNQIGVGTFTLLDRLPRYSHPTAPPQLTLLKVRIYPPHHPTTVELSSEDSTKALRAILDNDPDALMPLISKDGHNEFDLVERHKLFPYVVGQ